MKMMTSKYCEICGKPIPLDKYFNKRKVCSFPCRMEAMRRKSRGDYKRYDPPAGYVALADAIVNTAIEDIRILSRNQIKLYENPEYRQRIKDKYGRVRNYLDAKEFLFSQRMAGLTEHDGPAIFKMLMDEKGVEI